MCTIKFRTVIFFEDVISETRPMSSENVPAFLEKIKKAGFDIIGVYPAVEDEDEDYEGEEIIIEDIDLDDEE